MATTEELEVYMAVAHGHLSGLTRQQERRFTLQLAGFMMQQNPELYFLLVDKSKE